MIKKGREFILLMVLTAVVLMTTSSCSSAKDSTKDTALKINSKEDEIDYLLEKDESDDAFMELAKNDKPVYVKIGEEIHVEFLDKVAPSKTVEVYDYILNSDGSVKYNEETIVKRNVSFDDGINFSLEENTGVYFSSDSKDYEDGNVFRGFRIVFDAEGQEYNCYFIIRTDVKEK